MLVERKKYVDDTGDSYIECIFKSDNILKTTYFNKSKRLYIYFIRGNVYSYENIDNELYEDFENADSQGQFFHKKFFRNKEYRSEFTLYPNELKGYKEIVENYNADNEEDD